MESAFGHDFGRVRVHADTNAANSAQAVGALAYSVGTHLVFARHQYDPATSSGRKLLAHELAHVVQQPQVGADAWPTRISSPHEASEREADRAADQALGGKVWERLSADPSDALSVYRTVGRLDCTGGVASAPADPRAALEHIDGLAAAMADILATDLATDATTVRGGIPAAPSRSLQSFIDHFGLPPAEGSGFLNRLTGQVRSTQEIAASEEIQIVSRRFAFVARILGQPIHYACSDAAINLGGGCTDDCSAAGFDAFTCRAVSGIGLCPSFWTGYADDFARGAIIIHEMLHMIFGPTNPRGIGQIGDETQRGPGRNFNVSGCYEFIVDDIFGTDSAAACPAIP